MLNPRSPGFPLKLSDIVSHEWREALDLHIVYNNIVCGTNAINLIGAESPQSVNIIPESDETIREKKV